MDSKKPNFAEYFNLSKEFYKNKNFKDALKYIKKAIPIEDNFDYWILSCEIYLSLKKFKQADEAISNAIHINNNSAKAWYLKSKVSLGLMNYKKALRASNRALSIESKEEYITLNQNIKNFLNTSPEDYKKTAENNNVSYNFNYTNKFDNLVTFVSAKNIKLLSQRRLNHNIYYLILDHVIDEALTDFKYNQNDIYSKIKDFTECFVDLKYKECEESDGTYIFNTVEVDTRLNTSQQIAVLIHELAHHLLSEIFEQTLMYVFNSVKTDTIEAFAWYSISQKPEWLLMNEYCAHTVECYFMPYDGHNYESFKKVLSEKFNTNSPDDIKKIKSAAKIGNTFAQDIIYMLNKFFTDDLKNEIKIQYVKDRLFNSYHYGTEFFTNELFDEEYKLNLINSILSESLMDIKLNFTYSQLYYFKQSFKRVNRNL